MTISTELQRKYKYSIQIITPSATYNSVRVDGFTPSERKREVFSTQTVSGFASITGPMTYTEFSMKCAMEVNADHSVQSAALVKDLESLISQNNDTFDLVVNLTNWITATEEENSYTQRYVECRLMSIKYDELSSKGDDDMVHFTITAIPTRVSRLEGAQVPA